MKEFLAIIVGIGIVCLIGIAMGIGTVKLIQMWENISAKLETTEKWIGICISSDLTEEQYQNQYERGDIERLKQECEFRGLSKDILGCYGDDHYQFRCPAK